MNKLVATLAAAALLLSAQTPAFATDGGAPVPPVRSQTAKHKFDGKTKLVIGAIAAGVVVGALIAGKRHHGGGQRHFVSRSGGGDGMCRVWRTDCRHGNEHSCRKYEGRC